MKIFQVDNHSSLTLLHTHIHSREKAETFCIKERHFEWLTTEELTDGCNLCVIKAASCPLHSLR